jgi:ABC-type dipeptide/oligopeptide/nickel transport system ATPase component
MNNAIMNLPTSEILGIRHGQAVAALYHRIAILHGGEIVEIGPVQQVISSPQHPYTKRLIQAAPLQFPNQER